MVWVRQRFFAERTTPVLTNAPLGWLTPSQSSFGHLNLAVVCIGVKGAARMGRQAESGASTTFASFLPNACSDKFFLPNVFADDDDEIYETTIQPCRGHCS